MQRDEDGLVVLELASGAVVKTKDMVNETDWVGIRQLCEAGVPIADVAARFKVNCNGIHNRAKREKWLVPSRIARFRREIEKKQGEQFALNGQAKDVALIKAEIWEERGEAMRDKAYEISMQALNGVTPERAARMITGSQSFQHVVEVAHKVTGLEAKEKQEQGSSLAVNIGLLRVAGPVPVTVDVQAG